MTDGEGNVERGRFAYEGLDRVMHEKARLGILSSLVVHAEGLSFNDLREACALTDGNLSRHLGVLGEANLVKARKRAKGARQETRYALTASGRRRFAAYVELLGRIAEEARPEQTPGQPAPGWSPA